MIELIGVNKTYAKGNAAVIALRGIDLRVSPGEFVSVRGPSGCGKTTLLMTLGGMLHPTEGTVRVASTDIYATSAANRSDFRSRHIGFVFQMFHLVPYLTVRENVKLGQPEGDVRGLEVRALLEQLGLSHRLEHRSSQLSTGEQQRTALARALVKNPKLILADEPTGNLDSENASAVLRILREYRDGGGTVIVVTHGTLADDYADRVVQLADGRIVNELATPV